MIITLAIVAYLVIGVIYFAVSNTIYYKLDNSYSFDSNESIREIMFWPLAMLWSLLWSFFHLLTWIGMCLFHWLTRANKGDTND